MQNLTKFGKVCKHIQRVRKVDQERYGKPATISEAYYYGDQHSEEDKRIYQEKYGQYPLVDNVIDSSIDFIIGASLQNRTDTAVSAKKTGKPDRDAAIFQSLLKDVDDNSDEENVNSQEFFDLIITSRCASLLYIDTEDSPSGQLKYKHLDWRNVHPDPDSKDKQFKDAKECIVDFWYSAEDAIENFGPFLSAAARKKLEVLMKSEDKKWEESEDLEWVNFEEYKGDDGVMHQRNHLFLFTVRYYIKSTHTRMKFDENHKPQKVEKEDEDFDFSPKHSEVWVQVVSKAVSQEFLADEKLTHQPMYKGKPTLPVIMARENVYKKNYKSKPFKMKDNQDMLNKTRMSEMEYIARGPKGTWIIRDGTLSDTWDNVKTKISQIFGILKIKKNAPEPKYYEQPSMPTAFGQFADLQDRRIGEKAGVTPDLKGQAGSAQESGKLRQLKIFQAFTHHKPLFSTYLNYLNHRSEISMSLIPGTYTLTELIKIKVDEENEEEIMINSLDYQGIKQNDISKLDFLKYQAKVTQMEESPTYIESMHEDLSEIINKSGDPILKALLIKEWVLTSRLPNRKSVADKVQMLVDRQLGLENNNAEIQNANSQANIEKTVLGNEAAAIQNEQAQLESELAKNALDSNIAEDAGAVEVVSG
jgi:hypothetical protein